MNALPPANVMYRALVARDTSFDGAFFAGIRTTGVFCRPGCGARKPNRENVEYFPSASEALHAGFRPCQRCRPLDPAGKPPGWVRSALELTEQSLDRRVTSGELREHGIEPSRVTRYVGENLQDHLQIRAGFRGARRADAERGGVELLGARR